MFVDVFFFFKVLKNVFLFWVWVRESFFFVGMFIEVFLSFFGLFVFCVEEVDGVDGVAIIWLVVVVVRLLFVGCGFVDFLMVGLRIIIFLVVLGLIWLLVLEGRLFSRIEECWWVFLKEVGLILLFRGIGLFLDLLEEFRIW